MISQGPSPGAILCGGAQDEGIPCAPPLTFGELLTLIVSTWLSLAGLVLVAEGAGLS